VPVRQRFRFPGAQARLVRLPIVVGALYIPPCLGSLSICPWASSLSQLLHTSIYIGLVGSPSPPLSHRLNPCCCCCWSPPGRIHLPTAAGVAGRHRPRLLRRVVRGSWPASVSCSTCADRDTRRVSGLGARRPPLCGVLAPGEEGRLACALQNWDLCLGIRYVLSGRRPVGSRFRFASCGFLVCSVVPKDSHSRFFPVIPLQFSSFLPVFFHPLEVPFFFPTQ
jgi:hypothetical protein